ncbi:MAG: hypothetical protein KIT11_07750 [Fimbriimonadaceae bacterium]|nr:hypothetical protein [Fimbriimonadaceae bacterium]QYK56247.1 MAG: hypothetical protein KF733_01940 [Fimbriimonadaceae bacterium]
MAKLTPGVVVAGLHGSAGSATFVRTPYGVVLKERSVPHDPQTAAQRASRDRLRRVGRAWRALTLDQAAAWRAYAQELAEAAGGQDSGPRATAQLLFSKLGVKVLQVDPGAAVPVLPPTKPFLGDGLGLSVGAVAGGLRFTADAANSPGVVTELLLQPLASVHRNAYPARYRSQGFVAFPAPGGSQELALPRGIYAVAYRFVRSATGQETPLAGLGVFEVALSGLDAPFTAAGSSPSSCPWPARRRACPYSGPSA